jgi:hypothetical protein
MPTITSQEIITPLTTFIIGVLLGFLGHRYQLSRDRANTQRERLLSKINVLEFAISVFVELDFVLGLSFDMRKYAKRRMLQQEAIETELIPYSDLIEYYKNTGQVPPSNNVNKEKLDQFLVAGSHFLEQWKKFKEDAYKDPTLSETVLRQRLERLVTLTQQAITSDFLTHGLMIDPSGKLNEYFYKWSQLGLDEIERMISDENQREDKSKDERLKLRLKIRELLEKKLKRV